MLNSDNSPLGQEPTFATGMTVTPEMLRNAPKDKGHVSGSGFNPEGVFGCTHERYNRADLERLYRSLAAAVDAGYISGKVDYADDNGGGVRLCFGEGRCGRYRVSSLTICAA